MTLWYQDAILRPVNTEFDGWATLFVIFAAIIAGYKKCWTSEPSFSDCISTHQGSYVALDHSKMLTTGIWQDIGTVRAVKVRHARTTEPISVAAAEAISGYGLNGDIHADRLSPRQVLLVGITAYTSLGLAPNVLRENLLLDANVTELKSGSLVRIGQSVVLWLTFQCEACGHLNNHHPGLSKKVGAHRGLLARVLQGGNVRPGDRIGYIDRLLPAWSYEWRDRIQAVLLSVPAGFVVEYRQLARVAGVPSGYCRVFPRMLAEMGKSMASKAVAAGNVPNKPRWLGEELFDVKSSLASQDNHRQDILGSVLFHAEH